MVTSLESAFYETNKKQNYLTFVRIIFWNFFAKFRVDIILGNRVDKASNQGEISLKTNNWKQFMEGYKQKKSGQKQKQIRNPATKHEHRHFDSSLV